MNPRIKSPIQLGVADAISHALGTDPANQSRFQGAPTRYRLLQSADVLAMPVIDWCVKGVLASQGLAAIYGASGSGKSFLTLDLLVAIVEGRSWFGYRVKLKPVLYVALEGEAGIRNRIAAMVKSVGLPMPPGMHFLVGQPFKLTNQEDVAALAESVLAAIPGGGAVIVLDTLNRAAPGADENASADMGLILEAAKQLQHLTSGLVIVVHHTGKDAARGLRGHSSLLAALDAAIEVSRDGERREWRLAKSKDGEDSKAHAFRLDVIQLAPDQDGDPVSSCVVKPDNMMPLKKPKSPQGGNQKLVWDALRPLLAAGQTGIVGAPATTRCIDLEAAVTAGSLRLACPKDKRRARAREALTGMVSRGLLGLNGGWLWEI